MKKIRKVVIPVAGMGTRFLPITKSVPKEMLPIVNIPTIQYIVDEVIKSGIEEILFITSPHKKALEDYFDTNFELEYALENNNKIEQLNLVKNISNKCKIFYIRQGKALGTGHAIKLAKDFIGNEPFGILYGDDLIKSDIPALKQLIEKYEKTGANIIGVQKVNHEDTYKYGIIEYENEETKKIKTLVEKPKIEDAPSDYAGVGRYIINPEIFDELEKLEPVNGEYLFTDAMKFLMEKQDFYACEFKGKYFDIGNHLGYLKANIDFALDREDLNKELTDYIKNKINNI